jgi:hypothetical protein
MAVVRTDVSEDRFASIIRMARIGELRTHPRRRHSSTVMSLTNVNRLIYLKESGAEAEPNLYSFSRCSKIGHIARAPFVLYLFVLFGEN